MPVPWSNFEPKFEGPPFIKAEQKDEWAQARQQFYVVALRGPVRGRFGPQWMLTIQRPGRPEQWTVSMKSDEARDKSMTEALEALRAGESIGPCVFVEKEGDNGAYWIIEDYAALETRDESQAFAGAPSAAPSVDDLSDLPF